jgi:ACR3 family arsenite efflux pump ArsB
MMNRNPLVWITLCMAAGIVVGKLGRDLTATVAVWAITVALAAGALLGWLL